VAELEARGRRVEVGKVKAEEALRKEKRGKEFDLRMAIAPADAGTHGFWTRWVRV